MAEYTLSDFSLSKARVGASIGYQDSDGIKIATFVSFESYKGAVGRISFGDNSPIYYFLSNGKCYDSSDNLFATLGIVESTITKTQGNITTRADGVKFTVSSLQPREEVAMHCLEAIIHQESFPLNYDNTKIKAMVSKSFLLAQEFINQAIEYRKNETATGGGETTETVKVDSAQLSSDTDKLLYNICAAITNQSAQQKSQYTAIQTSGLKVSVPSTVNTKVSGEMTISGFPAPEVKVTVPVPSVTVNNNISSSESESTTTE